MIPYFRHAFVLALVALAACSSADASDDSESESSQSDLNVRRVPVLGTLAYGERAGVRDGSTSFRAYRFEGGKGDEVRIRATSGWCPTELRLLDESGEIERSDTRELSATLRRSGEHTIVFREPCRVTCPIDIALDGTRACTRATEICGNGIDDNCNGQVDEGCDPLGPETCTGTPLSAAEISAKLGGNGSVDLGRVQIVARSRDCAAGGSCTAWRNDPAFSFVRLIGRPALPYQWTSPLSGIARLGTSEINPSLALQITSDDALSSDPARNVDQLRIECFDGLGAERTWCRSWAEYRKNGVIGTDMAPTVLVGSERAGFSGIVTDHCLRLEATAQTSQVVILGQY